MTSISAEFSTTAATNVTGGVFEKPVFGPIDVAVLSLYFLAVAGTGLYAMFASKRDTTTGYFLAGRFITFIPIGASLFASNIGSEHFIGLAGSGAAAGLGVAAFELNALVLLQVLGWVFLPVYLASGVHTLPEYMQKRFGGRRIQISLSFLSLAIYILTKMSVNLYSGSLFIKAALHWDFVPSILLIIGLTAFCTITGGLAAVIYTDTVQAFLMVTGGLTLMSFAFNKIGGISELFVRYMETKPSDMLANSTCGLPRHDALQILRDPVDSDMPWPGFLFGQSTASIWYWCADQVIVQRALAAKSLSHAQGGALFAGYLKVLPLFMMVMPGMISRVLYADKIACATPEVCQEFCHNPKGCSNLAYPMLIMNLMPVGLRGLMVAVMLAALITDLTSIFNSASSLFTMDIYTLFRKRASNRELMIVGRLFVVVMTLCSIFWIPVVESNQGAQLYIYIQAMCASLTPPIAAIFLTAVLWPRANEKGAFWALMAGFVTGGCRMVLEFAYPDPDCGAIDTRPLVLSRVHYMYFALILFFQTVIVIAVVSLMTKPVDNWRTIRTVFRRRFDPTVRPDECPAVEENAGLLANSPSARVSSDGTNTSSSVETVPISSEASLSYNKQLENNVVLVEPNGLVEKTSLRERLGMPVKVDKKGTPKTCRRLTIDWLWFVLGWFCGISLDSDKTQDAQAYELTKVGGKAVGMPTKVNKESDVRRQVQQWVNSVRQKPRIKFLLGVNLVFVIAIGTFLLVFFSVPPKYNGLAG